MNFEQWGTNMGQASRDAVAQISGSLAGSSPSEIFDSLCAYGRDQFLYISEEMGGLSSAISAGMLSCRAASDLTLGVMLHRLDQDLPAERVDVFGGTTPVVTPPITNPGVKIQNNVQGGNNRMLFTGGHSHASIDGTHYDLVSGLSGNIAFIAAEKGAAVNGQPTFTATVDGQQVTYLRLAGTTGNGLSEFKVGVPAPTPSTDTASTTTKAAASNTPSPKKSIFGQKKS
jgi:hypothetical protein